MIIVINSPLLCFGASLTVTCHEKTSFVPQKMSADCHSTPPSRQILLLPRLVTGIYEKPYLMKPLQKALYQAQLSWDPTFGCGRRTYPRALRISQGMALVALHILATLSRKGIKRSTMGIDVRCLLSLARILQTPRPLPLSPGRPHIYPQGAPRLIDPFNPSSIFVRTASACVVSYETFKHHDRKGSFRRCLCLS